MNLFETPIRTGKVRNNVFYYQYRNGTIEISGIKYIGYSIAGAIAKFRKTYPK